MWTAPAYLNRSYTAMHGFAARRGGSMKCPADIDGQDEGRAAKRSRQVPRPCSAGRRGPRSAAENRPRAPDRRPVQYRPHPSTGRPSPSSRRARVPIAAIRAADGGQIAEAPPWQVTDDRHASTAVAIHRDAAPLEQYSPAVWRAWPRRAFWHPMWRPPSCPRRSGLRPARPRRAQAEYRPRPMRRRRRRPRPRQLPRRRPRRRLDPRRPRRAQHATSMPPCTT